MADGHGSETEPPRGPTAWRFPRPLTLAAARRRVPLTGVGRVNAAALAKESSNDRLVSPSRPRLLLVEDHEPLLGVLGEVLDRAGFEVATASTATEAIDLLVGRRYAAIVADCSLPDLPPLDWLAAARGAAPTTPLILFSGLVSLQDAQRLTVQFRALTLLKKPCTPEQLVAAVRRALEAAPLQ